MSDGIKTTTEFSLNRPVIWPSGKPQGSSQSSQATPVNPTQVTSTTAQVQEGIAVKQPLMNIPSQNAAESAANTASASSAAASISGQPTQAVRPITMQDIVNQLLSLQVQPSQQNINLASEMLAHGIELSADNFSQIFNVMKAIPQNGGFQEAALVTFLKGFSDSPAAVKQLASFLNNNTQLASQLQALQSSLTALRSEMLSNQNLLNPQLVSLAGSLSSLWNGLSEKLKSRYPSDPSRGDITSDARSLQAALKGLNEGLSSAQSAHLSKASAALAKSQQQVEELISNLASQAMLSSPNVKGDVNQPNFFYWQIPNALASPPQTVHLMIQGEDKNGQAQINPEKTKIIIGLETDALGKLVCEMIVEDGRTVSFVFNIEDTFTHSLVVTNISELQKQLEARDFKTKQVQVKTDPAAANIKLHLIPLIDINKLKRVYLET
jgi:hypothetical protein